MLTKKIANQLMAKEYMISLKDLILINLFHDFSYPYYMNILKNRKKNIEPTPTPSDQQQNSILFG